MTREEQIIQYVEKKYRQLASPQGELTTEGRGYLIGMGDILRFIQTLPKVQPQEPDKSLEEEYKDYVENDYVYSKLVNRNAGLGIARHFAEWGASQMPMPEDTVLFNNGVAEGRRLEREDMLKDAVEAYIIKSYNPCTENSERSLHGIELLYEDKNKPYLLAGDKVRIVVLKEEE